MATHRLRDVRKGSDIHLRWRGWRRVGRAKKPKRFGLTRSGSLWFAICACGWESPPRKGATAIETAVHDWETHRDG